MKRKTSRFYRRRAARVRLWRENRSGADDVPSLRQLVRWCDAALPSAGFAQAQIALLFCGEDEARTYNRNYRGKDYATNILSFAHEDGAEDLPEIFRQPEVLRGDLIVCPAVVAREAAEQGKTRQAHYAHLTVHGVLHLAGFDHIAEADAQQMESLEKQILNRLGYADPYTED